MEENKRNNNYSKQTNSNNDEIDLIELFSIIGDKFNSLFKGIAQFILNIVLYIYQIIDKWKIIIAIAIIVGGGLGYISKNTSKFYSTKATVNSRFLKGIDFITEVGELNSLCSNEGRPMLAKALNISLETAEMISEIEVSSYFLKYKYGTIDNVALSDSLLLRSYDNETRFEVIVSSRSFSVTKSEIQEGFEFYFSTNEYVKKNLDVYRENLTIKSESFLEERKELQEYNQAYKKIIDAQGDIIKQGNRGSGNGSGSVPSVVLMSQDQQKDSYIKQSGELAFEAMEKKRRAEDSVAIIRRKLLLLQPVEFVNRFSEFYSVSLSTKSKTALGMLIGFLSIIFFALLTDLNTFLKSKIK